MIEFHTHPTRDLRLHNANSFDNNTFSQQRTGLNFIEIIGKVYLYIYLTDKRL